MGWELEEQVEMLEVVDGLVDRVGGRLQMGMDKMKYVLKRNEDMLSSCCIGVLILVLVILLVILLILQGVLIEVGRVFGFLGRQGVFVYDQCRYMGFDYGFCYSDVYMVFGMVFVIQELCYIFVGYLDNIYVVIEWFNLS